MSFAPELLGSSSGPFSTRITGQSRSTSPVSLAGSVFDPSAVARLTSASQSASVTTVLTVTERLVLAARFSGPQERLWIARASPLIVQFPAQSSVVTIHPLAVA